MIRIITAEVHKERKKWFRQWPQEGTIEVRTSKCEGQCLLVLTNTFITRVNVLQECRLSCPKESPAVLSHLVRTQESLLKFVNLLLLAAPA